MSQPQTIIQVTPVILCGGSGTRLWPLSRTGFPKQFLCLTGNESLFQQAAQRLAGLGQDGIQVAAPLIVSGEDHRFLASEQLREVGIPLGAALLEPTGRNTAPALTLAALAATENGQDPVLVVTPADQTIADAPAFTAAVQQAIAQAAEGNIVILGVTPDKPETGYGYIKTARHCEERSDAAIHHPIQVTAFVEKPNQATAEAYIKEGGYFWNAGMFVLRASVWLKALQTFRPDIAQACQAAWSTKKQDAHFIRPGKEEFAAIPAESVDYAVMEQCPGSAFSIQMVPLDAGWSDLGAWDAVWNVLPKDAQGNAHTGDVLATDSHNTLVHASSRLVSLVGVSDLVVIETADAVLVADKSRSQDVKHIVTQLQKTKREEHTLHRKVHRPWGWYDSIDEGGRFKVKRIQVKPKASLSLQKHHHRAEHWIVVTGTAEITNGDKVLTLTENQSTYIPLGAVHRLVNPGSIPLEIIEVQSGNYRDRGGAAQESGRIDVLRCTCRVVQEGQAMSEATFTFRVDEALKSEFSNAAKCRDRNAAQLLRDFMRDFVRQQHEAAEHDVWFRRQVQLGLASANAGNLIPSTEVEAKFAAKRAETRRRVEASAQ